MALFSTLTTAGAGAGAGAASSIAGGGGGRKVGGSGSADGASGGSDETMTIGGGTVLTGEDGLENWDDSVIMDLAVTTVAGVFSAETGWSFYNTTKGYRINKSEDKTEDRQK